MNPTPYMFGEGKEYINRWYFWEVIMHIQLGQVTSTGSKFSIASILDDRGKQTEKRVFLPANNMRFVETTARTLCPFILLGSRDNTQVVEGDKIVFVVDKNWDPSRGKYPTAFVWGLWEDPREVVETPPPVEPVVEPVVSAVSVQVPAPYSTPHSGGARRKSRAQRRHRQTTGTLIGDNQVAEVVGSGDTESPQLAWPTERGHYDPDHYQVGLAEGTID